MQKLLRRAAQKSARCSFCSNTWNENDPIDFINFVGRTVRVCAKCGEEYIREGKGYRGEDAKKTAPETRAGASENTANANRSMDETITRNEFSNLSKTVNELFENHFKLCSGLDDDFSAIKNRLARIEKHLGLN